VSRPCTIQRNKSRRYHDDAGDLRHLQPLVSYPRSLPCMFPYILCSRGKSTKYETYVQEEAFNFYLLRLNLHVQIPSVNVTRSYIKYVTLLFHMEPVRRRPTSKHRFRSRNSLRIPIQEEKKIYGPSMNRDKRMNLNFQNYRNRASIKHISPRHYDDISLQKPRRYPGQ
jgi:hypothetical protein